MNEDDKIFYCFLGTAESKSNTKYLQINSKDKS